MRRKEPSGEGFDPFRSEFVDARFRPPSATVLDEIRQLTEGMLIHTVPHAVLERSFIVNGAPILVRKHVDRAQINTSGNEVEYPFAEIFFFDGYGDRIRHRYEVNDDGSVYSSPGFLEGYDWEVNEDGKIDFKRNHPRLLDPHEIAGLAENFFGYMNFTPAENTSEAPPILHVVTLAAETGIRATIREENIPLQSNILKTYSNDWIDVEFIEREGILPGMDTAVKLKLVFALDASDSSRDLTTFTIFEDGNSKYEFDNTSLSQMVGGKNNGVSQKEIDRRNVATRWKNIEDQSGLNRATQEHADDTLTKLKDAYGKVKWHLLAH